MIRERNQEARRGFRSRGLGQGRFGPPAQVGSDSDGWAQHSKHISGQDGVRFPTKPEISSSLACGVPKNPLEKLLFI